MNNDDMANPGMPPDKMIDPEHFPVENKGEKLPGAWSKNIAFPTNTQDLTDQFGDVVVNRKGKPPAKLRDILAEYGNRKFNTLDEFVSTVYGHSAQESEYQVIEEQEPRP